MFCVKLALFFVTILVNNKSEMSVLGQESSDEPYFVASPSNMDVIQGKPVTFPCEVTPATGVTYYWELNGAKLTNTTRRYQFGSNLHITRVDRERDSGQFTCIATNNRGSSITSSSASLNIQWIDDEVSVQLQEPELPSLITTGSDVVLRCHTDASGDVHFQWFRNADRLVKSAKLDIKKRKLHIKQVQPSDNGIYRCIASNKAGTRDSSINFPLTVGDGQAASIQIVPKDQIVPEGGTAYFYCMYNADVTEWYFKENLPLQNDTKTTIHSNGTLQINSIQKADEGLYNCVGIRSESAEVPQSYTAALKVAYLTPFNASSFEPAINETVQVIADGAAFELTCLEPDGVPPPKKWWMNANGHTISDSGAIRVDDDGRLIIDRVNATNEGTYTCVAENSGGKTTKSIEIVATSRPEIILHPNSVTVDENEEVTFQCNYETKSGAFTTVKWRKDGKILRFDENESNRRINVFQNNGSIVIQSVQLSDRGEYICEVHTRGFAPVQSQKATLSVIESLKFAPPPVNKKLELGSIAKVHCKAQGAPPPIIRWEKQNGAEIINSDSFSAHVNDMNGTLIFNGVLNGDKGVYNCIASNSQGVINITITIDVVVAPKFLLLPKNPTEVNEGESIMIDCVVEGDPKPTIQWDKNLKMNDFDSTRFIVQENGSLLIEHAQRDDENKYGCTAGSSAGLNRKEVQLIVHSDYYPNGDTTVTKAVLITMSVAGAYIILVIGLMVWCRLRRRSRKLPVIDASKTENGDVDHTELKETANGHIHPQNGIDAPKEDQKSDGAETTHSQSSSQSKKSKTSYDKLALNRSTIKDTKQIGRGEFGDVLIGKMPTTTTSAEPDAETTVLIKILTQTKDEASLAEFKREIDMFAKMAHENVVRLVGLCRAEDPHWLLMEHTDWGDLKQFLVATQKGSLPPLTAMQAIAMLRQLARGMEHLASARLVHRDLAARNCLIASNLTAKVGMPRLTRDPYAQEYCKHKNCIIPLRWLPAEAVYEDEYSTKSDAYSFGVLLGEVFHQGELPFPKINDTSFLAKLKEGKIEWKAHEDAPEQVQKIQEACWDKDPGKRPTFGELSKEFAEVLKSM